jgi:Major Facilitator Superfamily
MTPEVQQSPDRTVVRRAWWATVILFLLHGLIVSAWVSRIPAIQLALHLNNGVLGLTLLSSAFGAVIAIPFTGALVNRFGSRAMSVWGTVWLSLALVGPALAVNAATLAVALFLFGVGAATMDVSMNAQGVEVENSLGTPTMSRFHGMFSLGAMVGAGIGGIIAARGTGPLPHFALSSVVYIGAVSLVGSSLLHSHVEITPGAHRLPLTKIPPVLLALSAIGFCILLAEGAMADWTAVYLKQVLNAGQGTAAAGYSVFSASMAIFRFLGDWITLRLGPLRAVRLGSLTGAVGLLWALVVHSPLWAMPGLAAVGAGFSVIIPLVFGSGGRVKGVSPGAGIATVTGLGYIGFIVGPPTIGFASQLFTLRYGLGVVVGCCLVSAVLSGSLRRLGDEQ